MDKIDAANRLQMACYEIDGVLKYFTDMPIDAARALGEASTICMRMSHVIRYGVNQEANATRLEDYVSAGHRLALELECLLMDIKDTAAVSKWWRSANYALAAWHELEQQRGEADDEHV